MIAFRNSCNPKQKKPQKPETFKNKLKSTLNQNNNLKYQAKTTKILPK